MNWTTTKVPLWQIDCENFRRTGRPFQLRDVTTSEHHEFVQHFAARYELSFDQTGPNVVFSAKPAPKPSADPR